MHMHGEVFTVYDNHWLWCAGNQDIEIRSHIIALGSGGRYSPDDLPVVTGGVNDANATLQAYLTYLPAGVRSIRVCRLPLLPCTTPPVLHCMPALLCAYRLT